MFAFIHTNLPSSCPPQLPPPLATPPWTSSDGIFDRTSSRQRHRNLLGIWSLSERTREKCEYCLKALNPVSKATTFSNSLINQFFADHASVPLGKHTFKDIFAWLPSCAHT